MKLKPGLKPFMPSS